MEAVTEVGAAGLYLYAIVPEPEAPRALGAGVGGAPLRLVSAGGVAAVVHDGPTAPLTGPDEEVTEWILQHSAVVERVWALGGTVLPAGFNVLVAPGDGESAEERLRGWLTASAGAFAARLRALSGLVELRVEIDLDQRVAARSDPEATQLRDSLGERPPGVRRLLERKLDELERDAAERRADELYRDARRRLAEHSVDLAENRRAHPPRGFATVLNVAVLAERDAVEPIGSVLADLREEQPGVRVSFIGPWPPYSFTGALDVAEAGGSL
ncbi:GvpL/GvpF family gas vesicle protein [Leifsonia shinshuensis]